MKKKKLSKERLLKLKKDALFTIKEDDWIYAKGMVVIASSKPWLIGAATQYGVTIGTPVLAREMIALAKRNWCMKKKAFVKNTNWRCWSNAVQTPLNRRGQRNKVGVVTFDETRIAGYVLQNIPTSDLRFKELRKVQVDVSIIKDSPLNLRRSGKAEAKVSVPEAILFRKHVIQAILGAVVADSKPHAIPFVSTESSGYSFDPNQPPDSVFWDGSVASGAEWTPHVIFDWPKASDAYDSLGEWQGHIQLIQSYFDRKFPGEGVVVTDARKRTIAYVSDGLDSPEKISPNLRYQLAHGLSGPNLETSEYSGIRLRTGPLLYFGPAITFRATHPVAGNITPINFYVLPPKQFKEEIAKYRQDVADNMPPVPDDELIYIASNWCQRLTHGGSLAGTYDLHNSAVSPKTLEAFLRGDLPGKVKVEWRDQNIIRLRPGKSALAAVRLEMLRKKGA
jgi:hypothetical protein